MYYLSGMGVKFGKNVLERLDWCVWLGTVGQEGRNIIGYVKWPWKQRIVGCRKHMGMLRVGVP